MFLTTVTKPMMMVIGVVLRTDMSPEGFKKIGEFWDRHRSDRTVELIPHRIDPHITVGVYFDYDGKGNYSLMIGSPVSTLAEVPEGMVGRTIFAQRYAELTATGPFPAVMLDLWNKAWENQQSRALTYDIEWYDDRLMLDLNNAQVTLYISVK